jgi:hypothetical protein
MFGTEFQFLESKWIEFKGACSARVPARLFNDVGSADAGWLGID